MTKNPPSLTTAVFLNMNNQPNLGHFGVHTVLNVCTVATTKVLILLYRKLRIMSERYVKQRLYFFFCTTTQKSQVTKWCVQMDVSNDDQNHGRFIIKLLFLQAPRPDDECLNNKKLNSFIFEAKELTQVSHFLSSTQAQ